MHYSIVSTAIALALAAPSLAHAEDASADEAEGRTIIVTGRDVGYVPVETVTATKTATPLIDVPQSVSVITRELIEDQAMTSIADVLRYVPGAMIGQGEGHRDQVTLRGNSSTADFFVDGVRDDVQYYRGLYNVERVEVLKGPNAMIFGRGGGGGVINRVTKAPVDAAFVGGSASIDTHGAWHVDADVNQPIGDGAAVRVNAVYEDFDNHRNAFGGHRFAINPTAAFTLGERTRIGLSYEYSEDDRVVDRGIPSFGDPTTPIDRPLSGFRDTFFGVPGINRSDFSAHVGKLILEHEFSDALKFDAKLLYGDYDKAYQNAFAATPVTTTAGVSRLGVEAYRDPTQRKNFFAQANLVWEGKTGSIGHVLLLGAEYGDQSTRNQRINGFFDVPPSPGVTISADRRRATINLTDPVVFPAITFRAGTGNRSVKSDAQVFAAYLQDQISFGDHVDVIGGIRYDRFELDVTNLFAVAPAPRDFARTDDLWSPRFGLVVKPVENLSLYASYSRSYLPQSGDQFLSLDLTAQALKPEKFDNYELGVKWNPLAALSFTAAIYQLDRTNTRAPVSGGVTLLTGAQRSKGLELGLSGRIMPEWQVSAGYTLQDAEIRRTTSAALAGREVAQVPKHQVSLWNRYDFSDRIGVGLGVYHQSKSFASISNLVALPSYTRVDAAVFFRMTDQIEAQVNVENILDETYFPTAHSDNNITPGGPTAARFTIRARF